MTLQDLTTNRERIIKRIQSYMTGDVTARHAMVKPVMAKMVAYLNREDVKILKPTMANIDKLTATVTNSWIKYNYASSMTQSEVEAFEVKREEAKYSSI